MLDTKCTAVFRTDSISIIRDNKALLNDVCVAIPRGKITAIIGPNGAGKTTLLRALTGEISPNKGKIFFNSKEINSKNWSIDKLAKYRSVLNQSIPILFPFKVKEIIKLGLDVSEIEAGKQNIELNKHIERFNLVKLQNQNYLTLSGGEQKRTQLARVFAQIHPSKISKSCILLDEWSEGLDLKHKKQVIHIILDYIKKGGSLIMIVHDLHLASDYAEYCICLKQGKVIMTGNTKLILKNKNNMFKLFDVSTF